MARPIFSESGAGFGSMPAATPEQLARAVLECVEAGARVVNLSLALVRPSQPGEKELGQALDTAAQRGVLVVAAAGNQGSIGSSALTRHPWVIPVAGCDLRGAPLRLSNLGASIGQRGLAAPATNVASLAPDGSRISASGTSVSAPLVTGAIALLWSEFPRASAGEIKRAVVGARYGRRAQIAPPLLDAWRAHTTMQSTRSSG